jgi:hypothetical protein
MKKTSNKRSPYNTTLAVSRSRSDKYPDNVRWGRSQSDENVVTMTFQNLMHIYTLDLNYSFATCNNKIFYQKIGCPIGGLISAFYANTVCAFHEYTYLKSMANVNTRIYGIRQMDDLLIWIAIDRKDKKTKERAYAIKRKILEKNGVYKGGLELEEEEVRHIRQKGRMSYIHEFSGTKIKVTELQPTATCRTLNKNYKMIKTHGTQKRARFPHWNSYTSEQTKRGVIIGSIHRVDLQNYTCKLAIQSMYENYQEYVTLAYPPTFYTSVMSRIANQQNTTRKIATIARGTKRLIQRRHPQGREQRQKEQRLKPTV